MSKFKYFKREDGVISSSIITYAGFLGAPFEMEDVELRLTIDENSDMLVDIENKHYFNELEIQEINKCINSLDWTVEVDDIQFVNLLEDELSPIYKLIKI